MGCTSSASRASQESTDTNHGVSCAQQELSLYFSAAYGRGEPYIGSEYKSELLSSTKVLRHKGNHIVVWAYALDVREDKSKQGQVLFHYTPETAFRQITDKSNQTFKLWASKSLDADANFGFGLYGTSKEPALWASVDEILINNYWPRHADLPKGTDSELHLQQHLSQPVHVQIKQKWGGRTDFCIPVICDTKQAYDIQLHATPEMKAGPGHNRFGEREPRWRNVWVIRVGAGSDLVQASEQLVQVSWAQIQWFSNATLCSINDLASLLHARGRLDEAEPLYREALEGRREKLGSKHSDTLTSIKDLALLLEDRGRLDEAEPLSREALEGRRERLGPKHPDTLESIDNLAMLLEDREHLDEAEPLSREALEGRREKLGPKHPDTLASMNNLAVLLKKRGHLDEAEPLYREALEGRREKLGPTHPKTLGIMNNLAMLLVDRGRLDEAEPLYREALEGSREKLGSKHPRTLTIMNNLAVLLKKRGHLDEAEPLYREALDSRREKLGPTHPDTLDSVRNLAMLLEDRGRLDEAEPLYREADEGELLYHEALEGSVQ